jgi:DNA invertase Pin-like site-specific DNA recombinase
MGAISQMELETKAERAEAGRTASKSRGKSGGRSRTDPDKLEQASILYQNSDQSMRKVCELFGFSRQFKDVLHKQSVCYAVLKPV